MEGLNQNEKIIWSCWETKTPREVVREAAAKGAFITLAYQYLQVKQGWDQDTAEEWFRAEVFSWVLQLLSRKQFFKASHVLNKINVSPHKHMLTIAQESSDIELRNYITEQLIKTSDLSIQSPDEWNVFIDNWNLIRLLEKAFDLNGIPKQNKVFGSGKERIVVTLSELKQWTINKIDTFSLDWKKKLAAHLFVDSFDFSLVNLLDSEYVWRILLQRNMALVLRRWIILSSNKEKRLFSDNLVNDCNSLKMDAIILESPEVLERVDHLFSNWSITSAMIEGVNEINCYDFTKFYIFDTLCSFGYVLDSEKNDFKSILRRLSRMQNLSNVDRIFSKGDGDQKIALNDMIVQYCIKHNLFHAIISCVDDEQLHFDFENISNYGTGNCVDLWLLYKHVQNTKDSKGFTLPIYETCKHLSDENMDEYLSNNPILILAMLLFDGRSIFDVFNDDKKMNLDKCTLQWKDSLNTSLPHLHSVYQKWKKDTLMVMNDVTVYHLLSGYKGLDVSKVFEFQLSGQMQKKLADSLSASNNIKNLYDRRYNTLNLKCELPHFSNKQLVQKYAYQKKLNYLYYLKQNRPCMASQILLTQQYQNFSRLHVKMIQEACTQAHMLALQNWENNIITSSCISFITMIGCDSSRCRTHVTCFNLIAAYLEVKIEKSHEEAFLIVRDLLAKFLKNEANSSSEILDLLVNAIEANIEMKTEPSGFGDILNEWQTAIRFAYFHKLPLPELPLKNFVDLNQWLSFLIFGDIFKYPQQTMIVLCRGFENKHLVEHLIQSFLHQESKSAMEQSGKSNGNDQRRLSNEISVEMRLEKAKIEGDLNFAMMSDDIWEIMANCHGPEDPPGALIKASALYHCPILALLATCYEPDAVEICWVQWMLTSMNKADSEILLSAEIRDASDMKLSDTQLQSIMEVSIERGYYKTLQESLQIFYKESPLCILMKFIVQTVNNFSFNAESIDILKYFKTIIGRRSSAMGNAEGSRTPRFTRSRFVQISSTKIILKTLCRGFKSAWHQKEFLRCLCEAELSKDYLVPCPDFCKLIIFLNISMKCGIKFDLEKICGENYTEAQMDYIEILIENKLFDEAMHFANVANLCKDNILIAEWQEKHKKLLQDDYDSILNDISVLQFWTKCSHSLKQYNVDPVTSIKFLKENCDKFDSDLNRFYILRLILGWFEEFKEDTSNREDVNKDVIEYEMWMAYLSCKDYHYIHLVSIEATYDYILNINIESNLFCDSNVKISPQQPFNLLLNEIKEEANLSKMIVTGEELKHEQVEKWMKAIEILLDVGLIIEAWRLNRIFKIPEDYSPQSHNTLHVIETCIQIAEGIITPYELPSNLSNLVTSSPSHMPHLDSRLSEDSSFEELVLIPDKAEEVSEENAQLAVRRDADALSILEAIAARTGFKLVKQISNYFRIGLQIGWTYEKVLKYDGNPLDLINCLSGRGRMLLAKIVFRTYKITPEKIMEYLCLEIVTAIVSSHLTRTSGFRQKEHFRYTLWGYPLDSDFEMFLNMRPDDNSILGKMILEYLSAFRKSYKSHGSVVLAEVDSTSNVGNIENTESALNEEYHDIDQEDIDGISEYSESTVESILPKIKTFIKNPFDNQTVVSGSTTSYNYRSKRIRDERLQFDVISCTRIKISSHIKSNIKNLVKDAKLSTKQINVISIELLVLAHECFSSVCDTEGIAIILRSAQTLSSHLLAARSWRLMVRLVTGIARYTEMAYIFQMLRDNDQFEFLLGQLDYMLGQHDEKINNFKQGLLQFLRKHCPGDTESYCLVAFHFSMFSEAADVKKKQANDLVVAVKQMALDSMKAIKRRSIQMPDWIILADNDSTQLLLDTALNHSADSAELYAKAGCLVAAREMAALAQLIALQISMLRKPPTKSIFDLTREKMIELMELHLSFMEGLVYAHASDAIDSGWILRWKEIVFQRILKNNDPAFVKDISLNRPDIAVYIVERFDNNKALYNSNNASVAELRTLFK